MGKGLKIFALCVLVTGYLASAAYALAKEPAAADLNACNEFLQIIRDTPGAMKYAKTGIYSRRKPPAHSRAWFMAALGMRAHLWEYLRTHPKQEHDPGLLLIATYTGQRDVVTMLLRMGDNPNVPGRKMDILPLQYAASCERPEIMLYLMQAGANIYGTTPLSGSLPMANALAGQGPTPFVIGVKYLLAAGFDPRCPVAKTGVTALQAIKNGERGSSVSKQTTELKTLLSAAMRIAESKSPGEPRCGGLNWRTKNESSK